MDLSKGPELMDVPDMGQQHSTLGFIDLYA
ncbi:MAG: hypothetical protein IPL18_08095 [Sphingomonadales bacterium]|nr:hypothetical protein [Sphingomonadales bacterium]